LLITNQFQKVIRNTDPDTLSLHLNDQFDKVVSVSWHRGCECCIIQNARIMQTSIV